VVSKAVWLKEVADVDVHLFVVLGRSNGNGTAFDVRLTVNAWDDSKMIVDEQSKKSPAQCSFSFSFNNEGDIFGSIYRIAGCF
jgi:hypothetical protein